MRYTDEAIRNRRNRNNKIKKILTITVYILLIPLLVYNISLIFQAVLNPNETPSFLGIKSYVILSGSMQPEIDIGDIVIVKDVEENELQNKDIISFREGQTVITHRIIDIQTVDNEKQFTTKGDNNNSADNNVISADVIEGKVITVIPFLGKIGIMLKGKITIILAVIIFYIYLVKSEKVKKKKENRRIKRLEYEKARLENEKK